jgi:hypothetical protein
MLDDYFARDLWRVVDDPPGRARVRVVIGGRSPALDADDRARVLRAVAAHPGRVVCDVVERAAECVEDGLVVPAPVALEAALAVLAAVQSVQARWFYGLALAVRAVAVDGRGVRRRQAEADACEGRKVARREAVEGVEAALSEQRRVALAATRAQPRLGLQVRELPEHGVAALLAEGEGLLGRDADELVRAVVSRGAIFGLGGGVVCEARAQDVELGQADAHVERRADNAAHERAHEGEAAVAVLGRNDSRVRHAEAAALAVQLSALPQQLPGRRRRVGARVGLELEDVAHDVEHGVVDVPTRELRADRGMVVVDGERDAEAVVRPSKSW